MEVVPQLGISLPLQTGEPDGGSSSGVGESFFPADYNKN